MEERWPKIAAYFGLQGVAPLDDNLTLLMPTEYIEKHHDVLERVVLTQMKYSAGRFWIEI